MTIAPAPAPVAAAALRTPTDVKRLANAFCHAQLLLTADELGLFADLGSHGPSTQEQITERLGLDGRGTGDFLDGLVLLGLIELTGDVYTLTDVATETLVPGTPRYIGGFLRRASRMLYPAWGQLGAALRTGQPQTAGAGPDAFLRMLADPAQRSAYLTMMDSASGLVAPHLIRAFPWSAYASVLDVGGCRGNLVGRLLGAYPELRGAVFDLPPMAEPFQEHTTALGVAERATFHAGDFFHDDLPTANVVMLGHVLHNWSPEERAALVARAWAAVAPGGALLIYDAMLPETPADLPRTLVSLNMLLVTEGGSEYPASHCQAWLTAAGCTTTEVHGLGSTDTLVIGHKPR
ncbi:methyltransferase [Winogradskya consettensis]|uniref:O-methyltransferase n=1 Tax=Winogradskya consettensis TaxID=113560 RepID=A0A919SB61_9ACTN|nr:methyltransferase [Actinoplanes consettensis]GIM68473.1 O-methyltransferase [Actinoplanes consettensis]